MDPGQQRFRVAAREMFEMNMKVFGFGLFFVLFPMLGYQIYNDRKLTPEEKVERIKERKQKKAKEVWDE